MIFLLEKCPPCKGRLGGQWFCKTHERQHPSREQHAQESVRGRNVRANQQGENPEEVRGRCRLHVGLHKGVDIERHFTYNVSFLSFYL
jgi:hypothetical protein